MEIILLQDVKGLGKANDIKQVSDGFALNYLIPKRQAEAVTEEGVRRIQILKNKKIITRVNEIKKYEDLLRRLGNKTLVMRVRASKEGTLYAAIDAQQLADAIEKSIKMEMNAKFIKLSHPIKKIGTHEILIRFNESLVMKLNINVEADNGKD